MEGISHEAIDLAGHLRLGRLVVLWDDNGITIDGATALSTSTDQRARFAACGWHVQAVDGHDAEAVAEAIAAARRTRPSLIACRTVIGFGAPNKQGTARAHGAPLGRGRDRRRARGARLAPRAVRDPRRRVAAWREVAARGGDARAAWARRLADSPEHAAFAAPRRPAGAGARRRRWPAQGRQLARRAEGRDPQGVARWRSRW